MRAAGRPGPLVLRCSHAVSRPLAHFNDNDDGDDDNGCFGSGRVNAILRRPLASRDAGCGDGSRDARVAPHVWSRDHTRRTCGDDEGPVAADNEAEARGGLQSVQVEEAFTQKNQNPDSGQLNP